VAPVRTVVAAHIAVLARTAWAARTAPAVVVGIVSAAAARIAAAAGRTVAAERPSAHLALVVAEAPGQPLYPSNPGIRRRPAALRGHTEGKST